MEQVTPSVLEYVLAWFQWLLAPVLALVISIVYFRASPSSQPLGSRLMASAHGISIAALYAGAMLVFYANAAGPRYATPFFVLLAVPAVLMLLSFFIYRGAKHVHLLQCLNFLCLAWVAFIGGMAVTGDWL